MTWVRWEAVAGVNNETNQCNTHAACGRNTHEAYDKDDVQVDNEANQCNTHAACERNTCGAYDKDDVEVDNEASQ